MSDKLRIHKSWKSIIEPEVNKEYFILLKEKIKKEKFYPSVDKIFNAFNLCPFETVKVVILGQDPYHGEGQAQGLAFSVKDGIRIPPSLRNIFKELEIDLGIVVNKESGDLTKWAKQGVFLLNTVLTVVPNKPNSHKGFGWELFTDKVISELSLRKRNLVFILWGANAHSKLPLINKDEHLIITSPHPSPFSANRGFFGSKPFSKTNNYLALYGIDRINWEL